MVISVFRPRKPVPEEQLQNETEFRRGFYESYNKWETEVKPEVLKLGSLSIAGGHAGRVAWGALQTTRARQLATAVSYWKRPIHTHLTKVFPESAFLARSLKARKGVGLTLFGIGMLNPLENIYYAKTGQWQKLLINYHLPIVGVPAFTAWQSYKSSGSSSQSSQQNGGPGGTFSDSPGVGTEPSKGGKKATPGEGTKPSKSPCPKGHYWSWKERRCVKSKF